MHLLDMRGFVGFRNKTNVQLDQGATLQALPSNAENYGVVVFQDVIGSSIFGGGSILGERGTHQGTTGEWGMGIKIQGNCQNIQVMNLILGLCWGDGIYINGGSQILVSGVNSHDNRRQGLSIVNGEMIKILNSSFQNTNGTLPMFGIDIEPNEGSLISNVTVQGCLLQGNAGCGISAGVPQALIGKAQTINVLITGCKAYGNGAKSTDGVQSGMQIAGMVNAVLSLNFCQYNAGDGIQVYGGAKNTIINSCQIDSNKENGIEFYQAGGEVQNCTITNNAQYGIRHDYAGFPVSNVNNAISGNKFDKF